MKTSMLLIVVTLVTIGNSSAVAGLFEWSIVGNAGNAADARTGLGNVEYNYRIGRYEVTNSQYVQFLNAVAATDTHSLYSERMTIETRGGIIRSGESGSYTYSVKPDAIGMAPGGGNYTYGNKPVNHVSVMDALRFSNWLHSGRPSGLQSFGTTEDGAYTMANGMSEVRSTGARFFLPSENEWYKAAYHKNDGVTGNYWYYPTGTDEVPNNNLPSVDTGNSANFSYNSSIIGTTLYPLTDVGSYALSASSYDTYDQGGNVGEWNESISGRISRGRRGGDWIQAETSLISTDRGQSWAGFESDYVGFRIAAVIPEPNTILLVISASVVGIGRTIRCVMT